MRCVFQSGKLQLRIITSCFVAFTILRGLLLKPLIERSRARKFTRQLLDYFLAYSVLDDPALFFPAASRMNSSRCGTRRLLRKLIVLSRRPISARDQCSINACHASSRWRYNGVGAELVESLVPWLQKALLILMDNYSWKTTMSFYVQRMQICGFLC